MLPCSSPRETLLACSPSAPWYLPSFTVESTLSSCSCFDHLLIWYFGQIALFLFLLARVALAYLPTALSVALRPLFHFQHAQYAQVFLLKLAPLYMFFAGLGSTIKSAISLLLLSDSCSVLDNLSSPPSFLLPQTLWQELSSLSSCSIRLQWVL